MSRALLLAGGIHDPNLVSLASAAASRGVSVSDARVGGARTPVLDWALHETPRLDGAALQVNGAFLRYDVFESLADSRPAVALRATAWYHAISGWVAAEERVRCFNRHMTQAAGNKAATLIAARACGLRVPESWVTNDLPAVRARGGDSGIAKPVAGGDYCCSLPLVLDAAEQRGGVAAMPAIVQERLLAPEIRIYLVADHVFAFEMVSDSLDYRIKQDVDVRYLPAPPAAETAALRRLLARFQMDFGAADFKTSRNGELVFLELNTSPMFARFDATTGGELAAAMIDVLANGRD